MNPLTNVKNQQKLNQRELALGLTGKKSWHDQYKDSAWIFVGGLPYDLTEGDIVCVFSQYGEIVNINLVRDQKSGKSKGFCFICYEDQRSTILAVDNFNSIKLLGRTLRVDHVEEYKKPKEHGDEDDVTMKLRTDGCAPQIPDSPEHFSSEEEPLQVKVKVQKEKKVKKEKKNKKKKKQAATRSSISESESDSDANYKHHSVKVKKEEYDPGYDRAQNESRKQMKSKQTHSPDEYSKRPKKSKYDRDDKRRGSVDRDKYREAESSVGRDRGHRAEREADRPRYKDYGYDDRSRDRNRDYRQNDYERYDRKTGGEYRQREESDGKYDRNNDRKDRENEYERYDRKTDGEYKQREESDGKYDRNNDRKDRFRNDDRAHGDRDGYNDRSRYRESRR